MTLSSHPGPHAEFRPSVAALALVWGGALLFVVALAVLLYAYVVRFGVPAAPGSWIAPALINTGLFSLFALHHSVFARAAVKGIVRRMVRPPYDRSFYTWVASALLLAVTWWWRPVPGVLYALDGPWWWAAVAIQTAGFILAIMGSRAVDVLDLAGVRPVLDARAGRKPAHVPLVTGGVFRIVRHPLYFGWALFVFGAPHMTATRAVFAIVSTAYLAIGVVFEERSLVDAFGAEYQEYRRQVRWRIVPGLY